MKRIRAMDHAPSGLAEYLQEAGDDATWDGFGSHRGSSDAKRELRDALSANQHGLCAYCEIDLLSQHREIEHVVPRADEQRGASLSLNVANMVACCRGNAPSSAAQHVRNDPVRHREPLKRHQSCGQAKADTYNEGFLDPGGLPALPSLIRVLPDGEIEAEDACAAVAMPVSRVERTIDMLRLNVLRRKEGRATHRRQLSSQVERCEAEEDRRDAAKAELLPDESNRLPRFFTTARSYFGDLAEEVLAEAPRAWI